MSGDAWCPVDGFRLISHPAGVWPPPPVYLEARERLAVAGVDELRTPRERRAVARARRENPGRLAELRVEARLLRQARRSGRAA